MEKSIFTIMAKLAPTILLFVIIGFAHILCARINQNFSKRQTEPPSGGDDEDDDSTSDDVDPEAIFASLDFETKSNIATSFSRRHSREEFRDILRHALNMINHREPGPRLRGRPSFNRTRASARALGRALMENPRFGSSSSECDTGPSNQVDYDPEYCDEQAQKSGLSVSSMRKRSIGCGTRETLSQIQERKIVVLHEMCAAWRTDGEPYSSDQ